MPALTLTPSEHKEKRGLAHHLEPVAMIGAEGLTAAVQREVDAALAAHGLIKVRVFSDDRSLRETMLQTLAQALGAAPVQHIGKLLVLWRPPVEKPRAARQDRKPGPRIVKLVTPGRRPGRAPTSRKVRILGNERITTGGLIKRARPRAGSAKKKPTG